MQTTTKILVIQPGLLGDCVLTLPLIRSLRAHYQTNHVELWAYREYADYLAGRSDVIEVKDLDEINIAPLYGSSPGPNSPGLDRLKDQLKAYRIVITFVHKRFSPEEENLHWCVETAPDRFAACLVFMPATTGPDHITQYHLDQYNQQVRSNNMLLTCNLEGTFIRGNSDDVHEALALLKSVNLRIDQPIIALHPGAGVYWKKWHIENFHQLAKCLTAQGLQVLWIHGPEEEKNITADSVAALLDNAPGIFNQPLNVLAGLFSFLCMYIGNDSGITHLAAAVGCPTVSIFGPTNDILYKPIGPRVAAFRPAHLSFKAESEEDVCKLLNIYQKLRQSAGSSVGPAIASP